MAERIGALSENATTERCDQSIGEADVRNAEGLFAGSSICFLVDREEDAIFLLLAGQARAMADMELAMPTNLPEADQNGLVDLSDMPVPPFEVVDLYGFIYAYGGGAGPTEFYRDADKTERLFARLTAWRPARPDGYSPGWSGSREASSEAYASSIQQNIEHRIGQLTPIAQLMRDDVYFALQQEIEALRRANDYTFTVGTPAHEQHEALGAAMEQRRQQLGVEY
ncbi:hypothetical protein [Brevundimonas aveniformis]|uniref:hypothetical protein n=1 Tax=Brevundimonas aveniformis TaxID=370977 RepID=UPI00249024D5|nr:hypothetical protein [Brevundimonas aveniformis]